MPKISKEGPCLIEGCAKPRRARGWCAGHHTKYLRYGDPLISKQVSTGEDRKNNPLWNCYNGMLQRCFNKNSPAYHNYGGRGITVCSGWVGIPGFSNYCELLGAKLGPEYSVDRIDNDGNYSCGNCDQCYEEGWELNVKWSTRRQQANNRRQNSNRTGHKGVTKKGENKYQACIRYKGKTKGLGTYATPEEAHSAYLEAKEKKDFLDFCDELFEQIEILNGA